MARGSCILVSPIGTPRRVEGIIGAGITPKPGQAMQTDTSVALKHGKETWKLADIDADGGRPKGAIIILEEDAGQGYTTSDAYAAGDHAFGIIPQSGDEINLLIKNESGTADDHSAGEMLLVDDGTGLFVPTTGSPETEVAKLKEDITNPTEDTLAWCEWTGY